MVKNPIDQQENNFRHTAATAKNKIISENGLMVTFMKKKLPGLHLLLTTIRLQPMLYWMTNRNILLYRGCLLNNKREHECPLYCTIIA